MYQQVTRSEAAATIERAYELGCRYFDTSPLYGNGVSEARLGETLQAAPREGVVVSTKVGYTIYADTPLPSEAEALPPPRPSQDFSYDAAMRMIEGSLQRLRVSQIDMALIHDPDDHLEAALAGTYRALRELREQGVVRLIGVGMNDSRALATLAEHAEFDCMLVAGRYTLLEQPALNDLLPLAAKRGIAIMLGGPFNSGLLANPYAKRPHYNYAAAPQELVLRARRLDAVCQRHGVALKAAALQFPLAHPAISSVVSGAASVAELDENIAAFQSPLPAALWDDLRASGLLAEHVPTPETK
jgi:D-threo-aldose 1-dehydrogenase